MAEREHEHRLTSGERKAALSLAGVFSFRMLGLFLILPVFALYAEELEGVTPLLVGLAIGAYGLSQALLQIPFGMLSDRIGRKPVILGGLILFALGSVVAAQAESIYGVIFGRALQGSGAIAAAVLALAADLTREEQRTKAMAIIGMSIGFSFALALVLGPLLNDWISVPGIFWLTAVLAVIGILMVLFLVPNPTHSEIHRDAEPVAGQFRGVLHNINLLRLDAGILILHMVLTSLFLAIPLVLRDLGVASREHWQIYLPVMILAMVGMVPFIIIAEKYRQMKNVFLGAIAALAAALGGFAVFAESSLVGVFLFLVLFFVAFNLLEASLPSLISKIAPAESKGTAMGVYSSSQFAGAFIGGAVGGWVQSHYGIHGVFFFALAAALLWLVIAYGMPNPRNLSLRLVRVGKVDQTEADSLVDRLIRVPGVAEAVIIPEDGVAYLKVDKRELDNTALNRFSVADA